MPAQELHSPSLIRWLRSPSPLERGWLPRRSLAWRRRCRRLLRSRRTPPRSYGDRVSRREASRAGSPQEQQPKRGYRGELQVRAPGDHGRRSRICRAQQVHVSSYASTRNNDRSSGGRGGALISRRSQCSGSATERCSLPVLERSAYSSGGASRSCLELRVGIRSPSASAVTPPKRRKPTPAKESIRRRSRPALGAGTCQT